MGKAQLMELLKSLPTFKTSAEYNIKVREGVESIVYLQLTLSCIQMCVCKISFIRELGPDGQLKYAQTNFHFCKLYMCRKDHVMHMKQKHDDR